MNATTILDKAAAMGALAKMKLMRELNMARTDIASIGAGAMAAMRRLKLMSRVNHIRVQLGAGSVSA